MARLLNKKQNKKINKFFKQKEVHYALGGLGGIALYKTVEAVASRFPDLVAFVDDIISDSPDQDRNASGTSDIDLNSHADI